MSAVTSTQRRPRSDPLATYREPYLAVDSIKHDRANHVAILRRGSLDIRLDLSGDTSACLRELRAMRNPSWHGWRELQFAELSEIPLLHAVQDFVSCGLIKEGATPIERVAQFHNESVRSITREALDWLRESEMIASHSTRLTTKKLRNAYRSHARLLRTPIHRSQSKREMFAYTKLGHWDFHGALLARIRLGWRRQIPWFATYLASLLEARRSSDVSECIPTWVSVTYMRPIVATALALIYRSISTQSVIRSKPLRFSSWTAAINVILEAEDRTRDWLEFVRPDQRFRDIASNVAAKPLAASIHASQWYVTKRFAESAVPISSLRVADDSVRKELFKYYAEEFGHEKFEAQACSALGVSPRELAQFCPPPTLASFPELLASSDQASPLVAVCAFIASEGTPGTERPLPQYLQERGIETAEIYMHGRLDARLEHSLRARHIAQFLAPSDPTDCKEAIFNCEVAVKAAAIGWIELAATLQRGNTVSKMRPFCLRPSDIDELSGVVNAVLTPPKIGTKQRDVKTHRPA